MILIRIDKVEGGVQFPNYQGYFIADSFDFGVTTDVKVPDIKNPFDMELSDAEEQELSISKQVDSATVYLMLQAMKGRTVEGVTEPCCIDIHIVHTRRYEEKDLGTTDRSPNAFLKIRIEDAILQEWSINGSNDDWPTESIKLKFNRAAMKFRAFGEGGKSVTHGPKGWDQFKNEPWNSDVLASATPF